MRLASVCLARRVVIGTGMETMVGGFMGLGFCSLTPGIKALRSDSWVRALLPDPNDSVFLEAHSTGSTGFHLESLTLVYSLF